MIFHLRRVDRLGNGDAIALTLLKISGAFQEPCNASIGFIIATQQYIQELGAQVALGFGEQARVGDILRCRYGADDVGVLNREVGNRGDRLFALTDSNRTYLRQWLPWVDDTRNVEDTRAFIASSLRRYRDDVGMSCGILYQGNLAGVIGFNTIDWMNFKTEIGYWLGADFQGLGLITKACRAMIDHAFLDLELNKVEIRCATGNTRSCAIPQRLGFTQEGVARQAEWLYDHYVDLVLYGMLSSEWKTRAEVG